MSYIEEAIVKRLKDCPGVYNLTGNRIYHLHLPQETNTARTAFYPAITFQRVSAQTVQSVNGCSGLCFARYQIDIWTLSTADLRELREQVRLGLTGYNGIVAGVEIDGIECIQPGVDLFEEGMELYRAMCEYEIAYGEEKTQGE